MRDGPVKVLLVEDNPGDARLMYECLAEALPTDFEMAHVRRLSEALEWLWEERCDVVLLDLGLPDSHGLDTLNLTRDHALGVPIVVLTGIDDEDLGVQAITNGAQDYLVKGQVDGNLLARSLRYAVARRRAEEALVGQMAALQLSREEMRRSLQSLLVAQESVRRDIAIGLQTRVQVSLLSLRGRLQEAVSGGSSPSAPAQLLIETVSGLTETIEMELSPLSEKLYPAALAEGLVPALRALASRLTKEITVVVDVEEELDRREREAPNLIPEAVRLAAYRIVEEALSNVIKHAGTSEAILRLKWPYEGWLIVSVDDNGRGFNVEDSSNWRGLASLKDYAAAVSGEASIRSEPGRGTEVTATLPVVAPVTTQPLKVAS